MASSAEDVIDFQAFGLVSIFEKIFLHKLVDAACGSTSLL